MKATWQRWPVLALSLLSFYAAVSLFVRPGGYLSTDTGGKTASVAAMVAADSWNPDVGYWFADQDPQGRFHPFANTLETADGQWLNTTSLTMVMAARPVWAAGERLGLGGERAVLLFPFVGAIGAALAAGALERRIRALAGFSDPGSGFRSIVVVGVATPVAVYALDFWEHSLGLAGVLTGCVLTLEAIGPIGPLSALADSGPWRAVSGRQQVLAAFGAGLAFGFAGTMRQEALVYGLVAGIVLGATLVRRRSMTAGGLRGLAMLVGFVSMMGAHTVLEIAVTGGSLRGARAVGTAGGAGAGVMERLHTGLITLVFPFNDEHPLSYVLGLGLLAALLWWSANRLSGADNMLPTSLLRAVALCVGVVWLLFGLRFVPGLVPTTPLAALGAVAIVQRRQLLIGSLGLVPVFLVLAVQFTEGAYAQWGGRYLLATGAILAVAAVALAADEHPKVVLVLAAAGLLATTYGVVWRVHRSDLAMNDWDTLLQASSDEMVVVFLDGHHAREAGPLMLDRRWLSAPDIEALPELVEALAAAGEPSFLLVSPDAFGFDPEASVPDWAGQFRAAEVRGDLELFESRLILFERTHVLGG